MDEISGLLSQIKFTPEFVLDFFQLSMDTIAADNIAYEKTAKVSQDTKWLPVIHTMICGHAASMEMRSVDVE